MCLAVFIGTAGISTLVEEELGLVEVLLVAGDQIKFGQCHFCNLMSGDTDLLSFACTDFTAYAVGISDGDIEEVLLSGSLVVGDGAFHHVSQVVEFMAQVFHLFPALASRPFMWMFRIHGSAGVEVSVRFLCSGYDDEHAVDVFGQFLIGICLQQVAGTFDGFVYVRIVESESAYFNGITGVGCVDEVLISSGFLAFAECQGDGYLSARVEALSPEGVGYFHRSERYGIDGIPVRLVFHLRLAAYGGGNQQGGN